MLLSQSSFSAPRAPPDKYYSKWDKTNDVNSLERRQAPSYSLSLLKDDMINNNMSMPDRTYPEITTSAHSNGNSHDGSAKLATGTKEILTHTQIITITKRNLKLTTNITTIGIWNVLKLRGAGKILELTR